MPWRLLQRGGINILKKVILADNNKNNKPILYAMRFLLFLTFIFKGWLLADMQYMATGNIAGVLSSTVSYLIVGMVPFLLFLFASYLSYSTFSSSKYAPVNQELRVLVNKDTYYINLMIITCVSNIIAGALNFVAYFYSISITLVIILVPIIMSLFTVVTMMSTLIAMTGKKNAKSLIVSMCGPSFILFALLR